MDTLDKNSHLRHGKRILFLQLKLFLIVSRIQQVIDLLYGFILKNLRNGNLLSKLLIEHCAESYAAERGKPRRKNIRRHTKRYIPDDILNHRKNFCLPLILRLCKLHFLHTGLGQCLFVDFSVGGKRHFVKLHERLRNHVGRKVCRKMRL